MSLSINSSSILSTASQSQNLQQGKTQDKKQDKTAVLTQIIQSKGQPAQGTNPNTYITGVISQAKAQGIECTSSDIQNVMKSVFGTPPEAPKDVSKSGSSLDLSS